MMLKLVVDLANNIAYLGGSKTPAPHIIPLMEISSIMLEGDIEIKGSDELATGWSDSMLASALDTEMLVPVLDLLTSISESIRILATRQIPLDNARGDLWDTIHRMNEMAVLLGGESPADG